MVCSPAAGSWPRGPVQRAAGSGRGCSFQTGGQGGPKRGGTLRLPLPFHTPFGEETDRGKVDSFCGRRKEMVLVLAAGCPVRLYRLLLRAERPCNLWASSAC